MGKNFKDWSRDNWLIVDEKVKPNNEQLQLGCLQRIADATEIMAKDYRQLIQERDRYERWYREEHAQREALERSIIAHKANYTRLKNKLKNNNGKHTEET